MVKYIVGGVVVVLAWVLGLILDFPIWIPLLVTLVVALVIVLLIGVEKLRERRAARQLEKALNAQAQQQAATARPDLQHEVAEMQAEFEKAVSALKTSKKGGKKALYALPWYMIIGPPGCGKSTALRNSGLQFPYLSASGGGVRGLGGTRNCDWWMTSDGVILDTAGRWTSEDEDHDEWVGFLDLIKRFRPRKPLNGMIAAVSVGDLGGAREEEVVTLARRIRDRIDEVQGHLKMSLPVYVLFTKCDLIPGFVETFGDLPKQERGQVWGFTCPLTKKVEPRTHFKGRFDELLGVLEHRSLKRMGEDRKIANRELIYAFPQQISVLEANMTEFVSNLFIENVFKETPLMRGVYFTSGTQEGRPIDRVMSAMAEAFGQPEVQLPAPQVEAKSYFLRDMFARVVFEDADVAVRSPEEVSRQRRRTLLASAAILLLAVTVAGLPAIAWANNRSFLEDTRERIDNAREVVATEEGGSDGPIGAAAIDALRERAEELDEYEDGTPPLYMLGMYQEDVREPVRAVYLDALRRRVVGPLLRRDAASMAAFGQRVQGGARPEAREMREMYDDLKLHVLLTIPRAEDEPPIRDEDRDFIVTQLRQRWRDATGIERHDPEYRMMEQNLRFFAAALGTDESLYFPRNAQAVGAVRGVFRAVGGLEMAVQGIVDRVERRHHLPDVTLRSLVGRDTVWLRARERVRAAFGRRAWEEHVQNMIENEAAQFFGEYWVLGHERPATDHDAERERAEQVAALRAFFLQRYVDEWMGFINGLWLERPSGDQEHVAMLTELTSGEPQLLTNLIRQIDYQVDLAPPANAGVNAGQAGENAARLARQRAAQGLTRVTGMGPQATGALTRAASERARAAAERAGGPGAAPPNVMTVDRVRGRFEGFLQFAPAERRDSGANEADQVAPARQYEEQLEFMRDHLRFRIAQAPDEFTEKQRRAREVTTGLIAARPDRWRERFRTLLMPPVEGPAWVPPTPAPTPTAAGAGAAGPEPTLPDGPEPTLPDGPEPTLPENGQPQQAQQREQQPAQGGGGRPWWAQ